MRLSKGQIEAIASAFITPFTQARRKEEKRREEEHNARWLKTGEGKQWSKLPQWMKDQIGYYSIEKQESWRALKEKKPVPTSPDFNEVMSHITIAAIDAKSVEEINKSLAKAFK